MKIPCNVITEVSTYDSVVTKVYESGLKAIGVLKDEEVHLVNLLKIKNQKSKIKNLLKIFSL